MDGLEQGHVQREHEKTLEKRVCVVKPRMKQLLTR
jgi:hypothetical protein